MDFGSNLKAYRKKRMLSLDELSRLSCVSKTMLSEIETGKKTPTITIACKITKALGISLSLLVGNQEYSSLSLIRKNERRTLIDPASSVTRQFLSPAFLATGVEVILASLPEGSTTGLIQPHNPGTKEYLVVFKGIVQVTVGLKVNNLHEGDSLYFEADIEHEVRNIGEGVAEIYIVFNFCKTC